MTWWNPLQTLAYARAAGFDNEDAKRAATVALVASQGADHYDWSDPGVPESAQKGLFGLPVHLVAALGDYDLKSPTTSAALAWQLWRAANRKWDWHPVVKADGGAMVKRTLAALDLDNRWTDTARSAFSMVGDLRRFAYTSDRIEKYMRQFPV